MDACIYRQVHQLSLHSWSEKVRALQASGGKLHEVDLAVPGICRGSNQGNLLSLLSHPPPTSALEVDRRSSLASERWSTALRPLACN
jgi:hypothetical protein